MTKPSIPQGFRDFDSSTVHKRQYILSTIKHVFELHGFEPLETPAMENLATLTGKYGDEGDKLIFKVLNNGLNDEKNKAKAAIGFDKLLEGKASVELTERALKYDLTIPFARYVAMNANQLSFPYKRFQMQPVWRADRPQRGRYREFMQCDADVVGSKSLWNEVECAHIYDRVFRKLALADYCLKINSRKLLTALAAQCGASERMTDITIAIDKMDKIGLEKVQTELSAKGLSEEAVALVTAYLSISGSNNEKLEAVQKMLGVQASCTEGIADLSFILKHTADLNIALDLTLARGLNYYTGCIFEAKAPANVQMGSIGGGGRYDDLTGLFGVPDIAGVGMSFGVDRIYDVLEELNLFPENTAKKTTVIFLNLGEEQMGKNFELMQDLRSEGISCELYAGEDKLSKQFKYADRRQIRFAVMIGTEELENNTATIKNLTNGAQDKVKFNSLAAFINKN